MTFEEAKASTEGVAIVQDGRIICKHSEHFGHVAIEDLTVADAWQFRFKEGDDDLAGNYYLELFNSNGESVGHMCAQSWSQGYLSDKLANWGGHTNGALWTIAEMPDGEYSIRNLGVVQGNYNDQAPVTGDVSNEGYLFIDYGWNGGGFVRWRSEIASGWKFYTLKSVRTAFTTPVFSKITLAEAQTTDKSVVLMQGEKVMNAGWGDWKDGVQIHSQSDFDKKLYDLKVEAVDASANTYTIKIKEGDEYKRYLQASVWGHSFINANFGDKKGNDGNNGAVWTIEEISDGKYSIRSLGVAEGTVRNTKDQGYLGMQPWNQTDVRIDNTESTEWEFYTIDTKITMVHAIPDVAAEDFRTVCLPYAATPSNAVVYEISGKGNGYIELAEVEKMEAGKPYIVQAKEDGVMEFTYPEEAEAEAAPVENNGLVGTFSNTTAPKGEDIRVLNKNKIYTVDSDVNVAANKAYIDLSKVASTGASAKAILSFGEDGTTSIEAVDAAANSKKDGVIRDLTGRVVNSPVAGIYIVNGKKVMIK